MRKHTYIILTALVATALVTISAVATLRSRNYQAGAEQKGVDKSEFEAQFPIAEYSPAEPADPDQRRKRQAKGKRYDKPLAPLNPDVEQVQTFLHWEEGLPALPVAESHAVVIGEVTDAAAYLSNNHTGVYSEFTVRVDFSPTISLWPGGRTVISTF